MLANRLDPRRHYIRDTSLSSYLRQRLREPGIFTYFHSETGSWVVACWIRKDQGIFAELLLLHTLDDMTRRDVARLEAWAQGKTPTMRELRRRTLDDARRKAVEDHEFQEECRRRKRWLGKKVGGIRGDHPMWEQPGFPVFFGDRSVVAA